METQIDSQVDWRKTVRGRSVYCLASELPAENEREARVCTLLESAASFPLLLKAYDRFRRDLNKYDYNPEVIRRKPWELLTAHAGVYNAKSARAQTLRRLSLAVFAETGLPRQANTGFRGTDGLDWNKS